MELTFTHPHPTWVAVFNKVTFVVLGTALGVLFEPFIQFLSGVNLGFHFGGGFNHISFS